MRRRGGWFIPSRLNTRDAFVASCVYLYGMMGCAAISLYPYVLPTREPGLGLTAKAAAAGASSLVTTLYWWIPGMMIVCAYTFFVTYRLLPGTFSVQRKTVTGTSQTPVSSCIIPG